MQQCNRWHAECVVTSRWFHLLTLQSSQEARTCPSFANPWARWMGNQSKIMGPAASQNGQTLTIYEPNTDKYSFPVFNPLVRDRILPWTWGPVCTLMITQTYTVNNNCIATVVQWASGDTLLHIAFMTANDLTQLPIQMIPGAPLSVVEVRSWSLSLSDVWNNSWICTTTIPHSVNEIVPFTNWDNFTFILYDHLLQPCFCTQFWTETRVPASPASHRVRLWYCPFDTPLLFQ